MKLITLINNHVLCFPSIEFRVLELNKIPNIKQRKKSVVFPTKGQYRLNNIPIDQNWQSVWPNAHTFHPEVVPLPLRQGYKHNKNPHPKKYGNAELMKIPNFLHLTPPAIKAHCNAIKKFCTEWPKDLETDEACQKYFPIDIITSDYCYSSPSIREPLARIASLKVKVSSLNLNTHAKDKMLRLVDKRYNSKTDIITLTADRCPTRKQNLEYLQYLLKVLFHVSCVS